METTKRDEEAPLAYEKRIGPPIVPRSARVIGWLWIVLGGGQAVSNLFSLLAALMVPSWLREMGATEEQVSQLTREAPIFFAGILAVITVGATGAAGGVGLLRLREWGRKYAEWACWGELALIALFGFFCFRMAVSAATYASFVFGLAVVATLVVTLVVPLGIMIRSLRGRPIRDAIWSANQRRALRAE